MKFFQGSVFFLVLSSENFWKELISMFCKSLLAFLTFEYCEGPYLAERFLYHLCPCCDIVLAPFGVITRTNNKIVEIVAASECYLIINPFKKYGIKEAAVPNITSCKTGWRKLLNKKKKIPSYPIYNVISISKMAVKTLFFKEK